MIKLRDLAARLGCQLFGDGEGETHQGSGDRVIVHDRGEGASIAAFAAFAAVREGMRLGLNAVIHPQVVIYNEPGWARILGHSHVLFIQPSADLAYLSLGAPRREALRLLVRQQPSRVNSG